MAVWCGIHHDIYTAYNIHYNSIYRVCAPYGVLYIYLLLPTKYEKKQPKAE